MRLGPGLLLAQEHGFSLMRGCCNQPHPATRRVVPGIGPVQVESCSCASRSPGRPWTAHAPRSVQDEQHRLWSERPSSHSFIRAFGGWFFFPRHSRGSGNPGMPRTGSRPAHELPSRMVAPGLRIGAAARVRSLAESPPVPVSRWAAAGRAARTWSRRSPRTDSRTTRWHRATAADYGRSSPCRSPCGSAAWPADRPSRATPP